MQGGNPEFSQKFSEQIMNSALYCSVFCRSFSRRTVGVLIYRLILCRWVFKIHMQLALDHAVIQLADGRSECLFTGLSCADGSLKYICSSHLIMPLYSLRRLSALRP